LIQNAKLADIYHGPHDESLFLEKRERLNHGEERSFVETKNLPLDRKNVLRPAFFSHMSRFQSGVMYSSDLGQE